MQCFEHWTACVTNNDCFEFCVQSFEKLHEGSVISAKMIVKKTVTGILLHLHTFDAQKHSNTQKQMHKL